METKDSLIVIAFVLLVVAVLTALYLRVDKTSFLLVLVVEVATVIMGFALTPKTSGVKK